MNLGIAAELESLNLTTDKNIVSHLYLHEVLDLDIVQGIQLIYEFINSIYSLDM